MTALFHALIHLARLRWLGAAFCALAMLCASTHASALAGATAHARIDATAINASADISTPAPASASDLSQPKDRVGVSEQNSPLRIWTLRSASAELPPGFSPTQRETASVASYAARGVVSETAGAVTNLGTRTVADNASIFSRLSPGQGMSGVFDHATGRFILQHSTTASPLPAGSVAQFGGHSAVRADLAAALGENLTNAAAGRLSGFSLVRTGNGVRFGWNSGQVNIASHGGRAVPEGLRSGIEAAVRESVGL